MGIQSRANVVDAVLAVGDHVFSVPSTKGAVGVLVHDLGSGGTANVFQTFDTRPLEDLHTAGTFNADVPNAPWFLGATSRAISGLTGGATAIMVTVAGFPVHVQVRAREKAFGSHGA